MDPSPQPGRYRARRSPRHAVRVRAVLHAHGTRRRIDIIDYSQHGFKLERAAGIEPQDRVTVELPSGQRLPMIVLWVEESRAGVRFLGPIAPGHTVMRWLDQSASKHRLLRSSSASA
jgi:PilZ domain